MKNIIIIILLCFATSLQAQRILLMHNVVQDTNTVEGPGKSKYNAQLMSFGFHTPIDGNELDIALGKSYYLGLGWRHKLGLSRFFELGIDHGMEWHSFRPSHPGNYLNDSSASYTKERLNLLSYQLSPFMRFHLTKRGDSHGKYLDIAPYVEGIFISRLNLWERGQDDFSKTDKTSYRSLNFINPWNYGLCIHLGANVFQIFGKYRLSSLYKTPDDFPQLPRLTVGLMMDVAN